MRFFNPFLSLLWGCFEECQSVSVVLEVWGGVTHSVPRYCHIDGWGSQPLEVKSPVGQIKKMTNAHNKSRH